MTHTMQTCPQVLIKGTALLLSMHGKSKNFRYLAYWVCGLVPHFACHAASLLQEFALSRHE